MDSIIKLVLQLSDTTMECDQLLEELLSISDRTSQINRLLDVHWASALAIALRKVSNRARTRLCVTNRSNSLIIVMVAGPPTFNMQGSGLLSLKAS